MNLNANLTLLGYGTSEGVTKEWDERGRGRKTKSVTGKPSADAELIRDKNGYPVITWNKKPVWGGVVSLLDGEIEDVYSYKTASDADFHHSHYVATPYQMGIREGEKSMFFVQKDGSLLSGEFGGDGKEVPESMFPKIYSQLKYRVKA